MVKTIAGTGAHTTGAVETNPNETHFTLSSVDACDVVRIAKMARQQNLKSYLVRVPSNHIAVGPESQFTPINTSTSQPLHAGEFIGVSQENDGAVLSAINETMVSVVPLTSLDGATTREEVAVMYITR